MSRTYKDRKATTNHRRDRHITVRAVQKEQPDLRKLSRALIQLAMAQTETEARAAADAPKTETPDGR